MLRGFFVFKIAVYIQMLLHEFNHGTYHQGQLINILRQLSIEIVRRLILLCGAGRSKYENVEVFE
jgi:hypothetical protein